ncbi:hypothetical protein [Faecalispora jeddahensis]|uniref:hypothetical protein n=1 Tax=Faecalispora jeddahensis TaxID=1414721 RepID=UPI0018992BC6|nr:hypothetical protein [Faecalispora jeddahensis]
MAKTDKELAAEITEVFIQSWNAKDSTRAIQASAACDILKSVYKTLQELDPSKSEN